MYYVLIKKPTLSEDAAGELASHGLQQSVVPQPTVDGGIALVDDIN